MERLNAAFEALRHGLRFAPEWATALLILAVAVFAALALHAILAAITARAVGARHTFLRSFLAATRAPTRAAFIVFALAAALPSAPLTAGWREALVQGLQLAVIALAAWVALAASNLGAAAYLGRFHAESEDNFLARKHITQIRILRRALDTLIVVVALGAGLMTFESVRQYGVSLFASAGVAGLVVGLSARPVLQNLIAGVQIATTQPIRIGDSIVIENESGAVEEITSTYVVVRAWDLRRLIVPLGYFIEKPFQNWTRDSTALLGTVMLYVDYAAPVQAIREKLEAIVRASPLWDGQALSLQVSDARERTMELRALVSARSGAALWDLRCEVREKLIAFLRAEYPHALPRTRAEVAVSTQPSSEQGETPSGAARQVTRTSD